MTATTTDEFHPEGFFEHAACVARRAGREVMEKLLVAYYVAIDSATPVWAQSTLISALVYFGFPVDAVPDAIPVAGYTDDAAVLLAALVTVAASIRWRHVKKARRTMKSWGFKVDSDRNTGPDDDAAGIFTKN